ncbi:hypothetical protein ADL22_04335 [Streptomyces sp. NRRL F-4489]|nr:hypothetical protein ADL22_04335 [Streptomyces sp. NRRL F-4489]
MRTVQMRLHEIGPFYVRVGEVGVLSMCLAEIRAGQLGVSEGGMRAVRFTKTSALKIRDGEIRVLQTGPFQSGSLQTRPGETGVFQASLTEICIRELRTTQVRVLQLRMRQVRAAKLCA